MGCILGDNNKEKMIEIQNEFSRTNSKETLNNGSIFVPKSKLKSLFSLKNTSLSNLKNSNANHSTSLFNHPKETLILKVKKEENEDYEIVSITQNILKNKKNNIKIVKENSSHSIFSFGGEIINKDNENSNSSSSSFRSSNCVENEEIDFIINENTILPHQFDIEYFNGKYYLKGYNDGSGIFLKVEEKILILPEKKNIFLFNENSFLNILINSNDKFVYIDYNGEYKGEFNYIENNIFLIGRCKNCNIVLNEDEGISRIQFTFFYNKINKEFYIYDGYYSIDDNTIKTSTNGIFLLLDSNKILIQNEMIFKTGKTLIFCSYNNE